jgi:peptidyl-prolyl cis-trans isomerase B (cyclophilin B)
MSHAKAVAKATSDVDFDANNYIVDFDTSHGKISINLWPDVAPNHCKNLIGLVRSGFYDGLVFHRIIEGFMIQGGCPDGDGTGGPGYQIDAEFNDAEHEPGVLSMARSGEPNSAGSQFFICLERHPHLDGNYTAFGKTADDASLDVVQTIGAVDTQRNDRPSEDVVINKATVTEIPK